MTIDESCFFRLKKNPRYQRFLYRPKSDGDDMCIFTNDYHFKFNKNKNKRIESQRK